MKNSESIGAEMLQKSHVDILEKIVALQDKSYQAFQSKRTIRNDHRCADTDVAEVGKGDLGHEAGRILFEQSTSQIL